MKIAIKKGFSIAEVIISLFVITVGLITILGLVASSIRESAASRNQIIASGLAQEGFELVRNVRDNNLLSEPDDFDTGLTGTMSGRCIDIITDTAGNPSLDACDYKLKYDPVACLYYHSAPDATPFSRRIDIVNNAAGEISVTSAVWWSDSDEAPSPCNSANKCVSVQNSLTEHP